MKRAHFFVLLGIIFLIPVVSFAWIPGQPIVPQEVINFVQSDNPQPSKVQACYLVDLVKNLLDFGVFLSAFIATIMFVYAGILYVTAASNAENLTKAKGIFGKVILGFVIVLSAWLIVSMLLHAFTDQDLRAWTNIGCLEGPPHATASDSPPPIDSSLEGEPGRNDFTDSSPLDHDEALETLNACGATVTTTAGESGVQAGCTGSGCTSLSGLQSRTASNTCALQKACGARCQVTVTGGTETDAGHGSTGGHPDGTAIDIDDDNTQFNNFITDSSNFTQLTNNSKGEERYRDVCGNVYTQESDHWHVDVVRACSF